jgi:hypothetical protein
MESDFNTLCEDESPDELGELLVTMWKQCGDGDFTLATNALAREFTRHEGKTIRSNDSTEWFKSVAR